MLGIELTEAVDTDCAGITTDRLYLDSRARRKEKILRSTVGPSPRSHGIAGSQRRKQFDLQHKQFADQSSKRRLPEARCVTLEKVAPSIDSADALRLPAVSRRCPHA